MKITTVSRNEVPSKLKEGAMDETVRKASALKGTTTLKIECKDVGEAKRVAYQVRSSIRRLKMQNQVECLQRKALTFVYPIDLTEENH